MDPRPWRPLAVLVAAVVAIVACSPVASNPAASPAESTVPSSTPAAASPSAAPIGRVILIGRVVTMAELGVVEAVALEDGRVSAVGNRDEVMALADDATRVIELGDNVAYPGFIDAHSHWIGDREHYDGGSAEDAMAAALSRGWTSIAELWVNEDRLAELEELDAAGLPLRVDAYLAANHPAPDGTHLGEWYLEREPGPVSDGLRVQGVKFTVDNGWGSLVWWEPDELIANVERAHDAGWQIAIHTVSSNAHEMVLDAYEQALEGGPNTPHHRIEHAIQVTDEQLERMADLEIVTVIHPDGGASDWVLEPDYLGNLGADTAVLARWRDFVEAGLHVAAGVDTPWVFPNLRLTDTIGRPFDQVAGGMDGRGRSNPETPPWVLDQLLTADQGLRAVTIDAAWALHDEANRGHLAPGAYADVTILSRDITLGSPDEIRAAQVVATIVGGQTAFCANAVFCP